jgi:uncharacterized protein
VENRCAICKKAVAPRTTNRSYPFCSDRCRLLDLSKWLGEEYRVAGPPPGDAAAPADPRDGGEDEG